MWLELVNIDKSAALSKVGGAGYFLKCLIRSNMHKGWHNSDSICTVPAAKKWFQELICSVTPLGIIFFLDLSNLILHQFLMRFDSCQIIFGRILG